MVVFDFESSSTNCLPFWFKITLGREKKKTTSTRFLSCPNRRNGRRPTRVAVSGQVAGHFSSLYKHHWPVNTRLVPVLNWVCQTVRRNQTLSDRGGASDGTGGWIRPRPRVSVSADIPFDALPISTQHDNMLFMFREQSATSRYIESMPPYV